MVAAGSGALWRPSIEHTDRAGWVAKAFEHSRSTLMRWRGRGPSVAGSLIAAS
jgi:hypothetical protein